MIYLSNVWPDASQSTCGLSISIQLVLELFLSLCRQLSNLIFGQERPHPRFALLSHRNACALSNCMAFFSDFKLKVLFRCAHWEGKITGMIVLPFLRRIIRQFSLLLLSIMKICEIGRFYNLQKSNLLISRHGTADLALWIVSCPRMKHTWSSIHQQSFLA